MYWDMRSIDRSVRSVVQAARRRPVFFKIRVL